MSEAAYELPYSEVRNLLLLPENYRISDQRVIVREVLERNSVFKKLYDLECSVQPIIDTIQKSGLMVSNDWFEQGLESKRSSLNQATDELNQYMSTDYESIPKEAVKRFWEKKDMTPAYSRGDLNKYRNLDPTYQLWLKIKDHESYLKQWQENLKTKGTQLPAGVLIKGNWMSFSSYTGRVTAKKLPLTSIPKQMHDYIIAPEGHKIISLDLNSAELRFLAHYSGCKSMMAKFLMGQDAHKETADLIQEILSSGTAIDSGLARDIAKNYVFSMLYGASTNTIANNLRKVYPTITTADVIEIKDRFNRNFPEIEQFLLVRERSDTLLTIYGGVKPLVQLGDTQKRNFTQQASVAVAIKLLLLEIHKQFQIIHVIHDEIWFLVPKEEKTNKHISKIQADFYQVIQALLPGFPVENLLTLNQIGGN